MAQEIKMSAAGLKAMQMDRELCILQRMHW